METMTVREALKIAADKYEDALPHQKDDLRRIVVKFLANFCGQFESDIDQLIEN
jgi:hypothetical protein